MNQESRKAGTNSVVAAAVTGGSPSIVSRWELALSRDQSQAIQEHWNRHGKLGRATLAQAKCEFGKPFAILKMVILNEEAADQIANAIGTFSEPPNLKS